MKSLLGMKLLTLIFGVLAAFLLTTSGLPDVVTGATAKPAAAPKPKNEEPRRPAGVWLKAVAAGDQAKAFETAREIAGASSKKQIDSEYAAIFAKEGVPESFFTEPLNEYDFHLWYYAWILRDILKNNGVDDLKTDDAKLRKILTMVSARIARREAPKGLLPWPVLVWARKYGLCDRMAWLFAEFAYQIGLETRIVYLMNSKGVSPHTICEIRGEDGKVWTVDPYSGILLSDVSVAKLAASPKLMRKIWPKRPDWWKTLPNSICWIPAMPQDYRKVNQRLQTDLIPALDSRCPRFGEDPKARLKRYKELAGKNDPFETKLWFFPIRLMKIELKIKAGK
ncbi:MAG: hypothetical protein GXP32_08225 [Kiritimatiellaeota bacterium]|nr:hypothetical protein [Kiritimatiellota bacterium]